MPPDKATSVIRALAGAVALTLAAGSVHGDEPIHARVKSDRVNMRARPDTSAEVVGQAQLDERLPVLRVESAWVQVAPPDRIDLWVHRDFIKDGTSTVNKLNIRAGAGINYTIVGHLERGARVDVRGLFGEWVKIAPSNSSLWISRDLVDLVYPARPVEPPPAPVARPAPSVPAPEPAMALRELGETAARAPATPAPAAVPPPADLRLVPLEGQGRLVQREGELKPAPFIFGRPSKFRLVRQEGSQLSTLCYVRGNSEQLNALVNERLIIRGREYWVQGVRQPVIVLERIERFPR